MNFIGDFLIQDERLNNERIPVRLHTWIMSISVFTFSNILLMISAISAQDLPSYRIRGISLSGNLDYAALYGDVLINQDDPDASTFPIHVIDINTGTLVHSVTLPIQPNSIGLSQNGIYIIYSADIGDADVIDLSTGEMITTLVGGGVVTSSGAMWNPVDNRVAVYAGDIVRIADGLTGQNPQVITSELYTGHVVGISWSPDGGSLAISEYFQTANTGRTLIWDTSTQPFTRTKVFPVGGSDLLEWSPDGNYIAVYKQNGFQIIDVISGEIINEYTLAEDVITSLKWKPDGTQIAAGGINNIWIWDTQTQQLVDSWPVTSRANAIAWTEEGELLHNGNPDGLYINGMPFLEAVATSTPTRLN